MKVDDELFCASGCPRVEIGNVYFEYNLVVCLGTKGFQLLEGNGKTIVSCKRSSMLQEKCIPKNLNVWELPP